MNTLIQANGLTKLGIGWPLRNNGTGNNDRPPITLVRTAFSTRRCKRNNHMRNHFLFSYRRLLLLVGLRSGFTAYRCFPLRCSSKARMAKKYKWNTDYVVIVILLISNSQCFAKRLCNRQLGTCLTNAPNDTDDLKVVLFAQEAHLPGQD